MRAEIERLTEAEAMSRNLAAYIGKQKACLEDEISQAKRILGEGNIAFSAPVRKWPCASPDDDVVRVPVSHGPLLHPFDSGAVPSTLSLREIPLHVLANRVYRDYTDHLGAIHVCFQLRGGDVRYAISDKAIDGIPSDELARLLAEQMAQSLVKQLRSVRGLRG